MTIEKRPSLRKCIDNKCKECIYDENEAGTWRHQVERCTGYSCSLFEIRPKPLKKAAIKAPTPPVHRKHGIDANFDALKCQK